jgi:PAS domain S-box-containing protein
MDRFPEAFGGIPDAVLIVDTDGVVRAGNDWVETVLGYEPAAVEGRAVEEVLYDPSGGS